MVTAEANENVTVRLEDDTTLTLDFGSTVSDLLGQADKKLIRSVIAAEVNGDEKDLSYVLKNGDKVKLIEAASERGRHILRHSTAHVMAQAVTSLWPGAANTDRGAACKRSMATNSRVSISGKIRLKKDTVNDPEPIEVSPNKNPETTPKTKTAPFFAADTAKYFPSAPLRLPLSESRNRIARRRKKSAALEAASLFRGAAKLLIPLPGGRGKSPPERRERKANPL